jgi:hypothetical protein
LLHSSIQIQRFKIFIFKHCFFRIVRQSLIVQVKYFKFNVFLLHRVVIFVRLRCQGLWITSTRIVVTLALKILELVLYVQILLMLKNLNLLLYFLLGSIEYFEGLCVGLIIKNLLLFYMAMEITLVLKP